MSTKRKHVAHHRAAEIEPALLSWLRGGEPQPARIFVSDSVLRELWGVHGPAIVRDQAAASPGTRPAFWWRFDALEPRRRLGGTGTPCHEALAFAPAFHLGLPSRWIDDWWFSRDGGLPAAERFDPADPPRFESQAEYLRRHDLLFPGEGEKLKRADFRPETLPEELWPAE